MAKRGRPFKIRPPVAAPAAVPVITPDVGGVKLVWLGNGGDMLETVWAGVTFRRGVPTPVDDPYLVSKAKGNRFYEVIG